MSCKCIEGAIGQIVRVEVSQLLRHDAHISTITSTIRFIPSELCREVIQSLICVHGVETTAQESLVWGPKP